MLPSLLYSTPSFDEYTVFPLSTFISVSFPAPFINILSPKEVRLLGILILSSALHSPNASPPTDITPSGISNFVRLVHPRNAVEPIEVTVPGITTSVRLPQYINAEAPIVVIPSSITTFVKSSAKSAHGAPISLG